MSAKKVESLQCLVISHNGDGDQLLASLIGLGLEPITSGTGKEGADAIQRYKPGVIILLYHAGVEKDVVALRAIQASCGQARSFPVAVIVSAKEQVSVVRRLLCPKELYADRVNVLACPPIDQPADVLGEQLEPVLQELLKQHRRQSRKTAQAAPA